MRLRGITVLLVEDDADNLELMAAYFDDEGARTLGASSTVAALAITQVAPVDIVVSDLELLDGNGCDLLRELRRREGMRELPAIAITGYSERKWRDHAANCGFSRYAVKPFSLDQLVDWIAELSGRAKKEDVRASTFAAELVPGERGRLAR